MTNTAPHAMSAADEDRLVDLDHTAATNHFAGQFCGCGDYSCPANDNENARCVNNDHFVPVEFTYDLD